MKFAVIFLDLEEADCTILSVHSNYKNALEALNLALDGNHQFNDPIYYKKYHDNKNMISIYKTHYIMSKTLIGRFCIKSFGKSHDLKQINTVKE